MENTISQKGGKIMRSNNYIFIIYDSKKIAKLTKDIRALTMCCGILFMICVKNHIDICERDTIIEKLRAERNDENA